VHEPSSSAFWDDEADESALAAMTESFHSEGGRRSRRKYLSWSSERRSGRGGSVGRNLNRIGIPAPGDVSLEEPLSSERGRSLERAAPQTELGRRVTSSRASHRGASMIFFAVWALFSIGTLTGTDRRSISTTTNLGRVLMREVVGTTYIPSLPLPRDTTRPLIPANLERDDHREHPPYPDDPPRKGGPSIERIIGRISAWLCTTLYLTSRLPQIWKNVGVSCLCTQSPR
jgi:solute carrier family 66 (lysosomal lysine-arginine transporter), member 1